MTRQQQHRRWKRIAAFADAHPEMGCRPIGDKFGVCSRVVLYAIRKHGKPRRPGRPSRINHDLVAEYVQANNHLTYAQVAQELGISATSVFLVCDARGWERYRGRRKGTRNKTGRYDNVDWSKSAKEIAYEMGVKPGTVYRAKQRLKRKSEARKAVTTVNPA